MPARSDMYRRFAIQAKQQLSQSSDLGVRQQFADIADHWAALAEQSDWLDKRVISSIAQQQQVTPPAPSSEHQPTLHQQQEQWRKPSGGEAAGD